MVIRKTLKSLLNLFADLIFCRVVGYKEAMRRYGYCFRCDENENETCKICGCTIEDKVMFKNQSCPAEKSKW